MGRRATVARAAFPRGRRVLAISDVHGNLPMLRGVLEAARFTPDDILVLVGDLVEKGPDSLATLRYVMELARRQTVHCVRGNCDDLVAEFTGEAGGIPPEFYHRYLNQWRERCLLIQMGREAGFLPGGAGDLPRLRAVLRARFAPELEFLRAMPVVLETEDYLFVHGGLPGEEDLEEQDAWACMKYDNFLAGAGAFRRWCVVGHWPVTLYQTHVPSSVPLLDGERHIASIDGGCSLTMDGQLNALILPPAPGGAFSWASYDGLPQIVALDAQRGSERSINITYGKNEVQVLSRGEELSRCRHLDSGWELEILNDNLYVERGVTKTEDATDYRLPVAPGDTLSLVRRVRGGCLAKRSGVTGWYFGQFSS